MKFSSFIMLAAAGLTIAAPITPVSTDKTLTIQPAEVVKRQTTLDPVVDAAHGKLPVPIKRATPSVSSLGVLTGAVPGGLPVKRGAPSVSSLGALTGAVPGGLPVGKRQLGGLIPSGSSTDDGSSESAEEKEPKAPKEPKEPGTVTDGTTEIDDGTAKSSTSSATDVLGGLPLGKRQLEGITSMLSPKPADPKPADAEATGEDASADAPATEESKDETAEGSEPEEEAAPPADKSALAGILKRQLDGLTKGLIPSSTPEDAKDAEGDADTEAADKDAEDETAPAEETPEEEAAPAESKTAEETAPAKNATEPAPAKKQGLAGLLGM